MGANLAPGKRTVTAVLRVMGLRDEQQFQNYHHGLNRARWSGLRLSQILLGLLVELASGTVLWYTPGEAPLPLRWGLVRDPRGTFAPQAFCATDQLTTPGQIVEWFVLRWREEVTFEEARTHLGLETQRQWSELAAEESVALYRH